MKFVKMHGTGNDYVYVDLFREKVADPVAAAQALSHRRFGVGGDGLILIKPREGADGEMVMFNADGSTSEMCGNGLRCVAKYVHDHYARGKDELKLMTGAGWRLARVARRDAAGNADLIRIDMGEPVWQGLKIPTTLDLPEVLERTLEAGGRTFTFSSVSMGNPHCVIYVDDVARFPVETYGPLIETHPLFPRKVNVEFVQVVGPSEVIQRTWERGSGETWACGTGASAVAAVGRRLGKTGAELTIHLTGGDLRLEYAGQGSVFMTGNAVEVFSGEWPGA
ncbi:MAG TPA: diaminopimelate epimerase [Fibrobacteria bacterium]|nr:diaminopimelate epimerase [Fibrobacteria bacterium]